MPVSLGVWKRDVGKERASLLSVETEVDGVGGVCVRVCVVVVVYVVGVMVVVCFVSMGLAGRRGVGVVVHLSVNTSCMPASV